MITSLLVVLIDGAVLAIAGAAAAAPSATMATAEKAAEALFHQSMVSASAAIPSRTPAMDTVWLP